MGIHKNPPEYVLRGLRMALGVAITMSIAFCGINARLRGGGPQAEHYMKLVASGARAAGVTCVVVAAPVIGKVVEVAEARTIGTILGGLCGWASFAAAYKLWEGRAGDYVNRYLTISGLAFLFAIGSVVVFWKVARLEMTPKLFTLTFLLVAYDGSDLTTDMEVMISRVAGIMAGVVISLMLAITVYPTSATQEVLEDIKRALYALAKLNRAAVEEASAALGYQLYDEEGHLASDWCRQQQGLPCRQHAQEQEQQQQQHHAPQQAQARKSKSKEDRGGKPETKPLLEGEHQRHDAADPDSANGHAKATERALVEVLSCLSHAKEMLPLTQNEAFVGTCFGRMWFLPIGWRTVRHLPKGQVEEIMTEIRRTAWLLWRVHLTFRQMASRQGMGAYLALVLLRNMPEDIIQELATTAQFGFEQTAERFPAIAEICEGLERFKQHVQLLISFSERQHRVILQHLRKERCQRNASKRRRHSREQPPSQAEQSLAAVVNWEQEQSSTFVHIPEHAMEEGRSGASANGTCGSGGEGGDVWEEHLWEAAAAEVQIGIPGSDMDKEADQSGAEVAQTLEGASPEDQAIFSADSVEGKIAEVRWFSFQVLMEELAEEFQRLHDRLRGLALALPDAACSAVLLGGRRNTPEQSLF